MNLLEEWEEKIKSWDIYKEEDKPGCYFEGLVSEIGEYADKIKKSKRDNLKLDLDAIALELGDALWYLTRLANHYGYTLEQIMSMNFHKLKSRDARKKISGSGDNR